MKPSNEARLEKVLKKFEKEIDLQGIPLSDDPRRDLGLALGAYAIKCADHPGCIRLELVFLRNAAIGAFLDHAKRHAGDPTALKTLADLFAAGYPEDHEPRYENPFAPIPRSEDRLEHLNIPSRAKKIIRARYEQSVEDDLRRCMKGKIDLKELSMLEAKIAKMELERNKILAAIRITAPGVALSKDDGETIKQLGALWMRLELYIAKKDYKFDDFTGNLTLAAVETKGTLGNPKNKPILLKKIPDKLLGRSRDYFRGGNRERRLSKKETEPQTVPLSDEMEDVLPGAFMDLEEMMDAKLLLDQISPEDRLIGQKRVEGIKLTPKDRQWAKRHKGNLEKLK